MIAPIVKIGNSKGIRLPKAIIEQCGLGDTVELSVKGEQLVVSPVRKVREGWKSMFAKAAKQDTVLLDITNDWDDRDWTW